MKNMILNLSNHQVQDILEELGMIDDNGNCPYTAEEIFKSALEYSASYYVKTNKREWSEEDEYNFNTIYHLLDLKKEIYKKQENREEFNRYDTLCKWLKSLKQKIGE